MGIESTAAVGVTTGNTTVINVSYVGNFVVPSQEITLKGKPAWTKELVIVDLLIMNQL